MKDQESRALVEISKAETALIRASDIHDILDLRNASMAYVLFADAQGFREAAQKAKIFQLKAERKAGTWLERHVKAHRPSELSHDATVLPDGVDKYESSRWQLEASVPEEAFNVWADDCIAENKEITAIGLQRLARQRQFQIDTFGGPAHVPDYMRWEVWERDDFRCRHCGVRRFLTIDHIVPRSLGGETMPDNLQTLCLQCNSRKGIT